MTRARGILFQAPLVRAILSGTKTVTRRLVKPQPVQTLPNEKPLPSPSGDPWTIYRGKGWRWQKSKTWSSFVADECGPSAFAESLAEHSPYGVTGDRLWVRETWGFDSAVRADFKPSGRHDLSGMDLLEHIVYRADEQQRAVPHWRPAIHLPRWASRITLEVTEVRVERLQDVTEEDARAEGVRSCDRCDGTGIDPVRVGADPEWCATCGGGAQGATCRDAFAVLWDSINRERASWASNPWLWVIRFRRLP